MGYDDETDFQIPVQTSHKRLDFLRSPAIKISRGFIKQDAFRFGYQRPGNGNPLTLATGKLCRFMILARFKSDPGQHGGTALEIQALMANLNRELKISFVIVTHDEQLASAMDRRLLLADGQLRDEEEHP